MFEGEARLTNPETGELAGTFHEHCHEDGTTSATVRLCNPIRLQGTELLEVVGTQSPTPVISVGASDPAGTEVCEFHGKSSIGCLADGSEISLVKSPGGPLGTLLIVLGKGTIQTSN